MQTSLLKLSDKLNGLEKLTRSFFYGYFYPVIFSLTLLLFWILNLQLVGFAIILVTACFLFVTNKDFTPIIPLLLFVSMVFRDTTVFNGITPYLMIAPVAISLAINVIRFPPKNLRFDNLCFIMVVVSITLLLGGIFSPFFVDLKYGLHIVVTAGVTMLVIYFVFSNKLCPPSEVDFKKYFATCLLAAANLACLQLLYANLHILLYGNTEFVLPSIGWANTNHIGYIILIAVPFCFYLMLKTRYVPYLIVELVFLIFCAIVSNSDGSFGILIIFSPIMFFAVYRKIPLVHFRKFHIFCVVLLSALLACEIVVLFSDTVIISLQDELNSVISSDNGRTPLYNEAIRLFLLHPLMGTGIGHGFNNDLLLSSASGYYHSTLYQLLASCGIVGIVVYLVYYVQRYRVLGKNYSDFSFFSVMSFLLFSIYSMVDCGEFNFILIYVTVTLAVCNYLNNKKDNASYTLPLCVKRENRVIR